MVLPTMLAARRPQLVVLNEGLDSEEWVSFREHHLVCLLHAVSKSTPCLQL